ncbi:MAG: transglutaminase family protein [Hydrogenophilaceae bacterium]|jgi:transglutaminase-like putative cysteine protease|nr:transglutaminase family protein [Hydrogenophilaceae bacterium]
MRLRIEHRTVYRYGAPIARGVQLVRLFPSAHAGAAVLSWRVTAEGGRVGETFPDGFGNRCALVDLDGGVTQTEIRVNGHVETFDRGGGVEGLAEPLPASYFLRETRLTAADEAIRRLTIEPDAPRERAIALMHLVRDKVDYQPGATDVTHSAAEAFGLGAGVCQDHAHIFLAAARAQGMPARYVSGYLFAGDWHAASHAWVEAFVGDGWIALDPANREIVNDHYVRLAGGLDYADARPIAGVRFGGAEESLHVDVDVQHQQ